MDLAVVDPAEWMPRIIPLMVAHWAETGFDFEFKPSLDTYHNLYAAGLLFAVVALVDGEPVGYCTATVIQHPHNPAIRFAASDAIFVKPEFRNGLVSGRLMKRIEQESQARGAHYFAWHTRAGTPLAAMLERHNYQAADVVMMRRL